MTFEDISSAYKAGKISTKELKDKLRGLRKDLLTGERYAGKNESGQKQSKVPQNQSTFFTECQRVNRIKNGRPIFWIHGAFGDASVYIPLAKQIQRPFYGIQARGLFDDKPPLTGMKTIATFYRTLIQSIQPEGPYDLGGYSVGGTIAYEIAYQLQTVERTVQSLTLVDSLYPPYNKKVVGSFYDFLYLLSMALVDMTFRNNPTKSITILESLEKPSKAEADEEMLLEIFVNFCMEAGVNKPKEWVRTYITRMVNIQNGYQAGDYVPPPLNHKIPFVQYFKNRDGLFFGKKAAHINPQSNDPLLGVDYWSEWKNLLPNIEYLEVIVDNHLMLFEEKTALQEISEYCCQIYHQEDVGALPVQPGEQKSPLFSATPDTSLLTADKKELEERAIHYFKTLFASTLRLSVHQIQANEPLETYGIDSLMATQLANQLQEIFGSLSITLFFEYQTIQELTDYFLESHGEELREILGMHERSDCNEIISQDSDVLKSPSGSRNRQCHKQSTSIEKQPFTAQESSPLDIAIIGLSGRYPQARDIEHYWQNLRDGKDCITEVPDDRWDWREYYTEDRRQSGVHYSKWGGFIEDVDKFDPLFFNISPREAKFIDPQERLFLEHAWAAMEDAGYCRDDFQRAEGPFSVGVYVGVMSSEYQFFGVEASQRGKRMAFAGSFASIANRVSYVLNLHGPSMALDTACSSSLTSLHLACQDLKHRKTDFAIAGGVNVSVHPNKYLGLSMAQFISPRGHCESFGEGGDGYIPGEGVGVVLIRRLVDAERDRDHIYGVIKASAVNHGGKTNGYSVPNPKAQQMAIASALNEAGTDPRTIGYIEAHGTGTKLGDPIEITGLTKAFRKHTQERQYCHIGSAKSNIGHCESAAGIAGVTKVLLQLQYRKIAPSLHSRVLNPHIDFGATPFIVNQELREWKRPFIDGEAIPRIAGISSFGAGGSNAHLIVEEHQTSQPVKNRSYKSYETYIILLSAKTEDRLKEATKNLQDYLHNQIINLKSEIINLTDVAYTLQAGREPMEHRLAVIVGSVKELEDKLKRFIDGEGNIENLYRGEVRRDQESFADFTDDDDLAKTIDAWVTQGKYAKILKLWVKGLNFDWNKLYGDTKPGRISLPTYPFAKQRYWISDSPEENHKSKIINHKSSWLHPLVHENTSNFDEQRFSSTFKGKEFFIADHIVHGQKVIPEVAYLEMAQAAVYRAGGSKANGQTKIRLKNVAWDLPMTVPDQPVRVHIGLVAEDSGEISYEIYSESEGVNAEVEKDCDGHRWPIHNQGFAELYSLEQIPMLDLPALKNRIHQNGLSPEQLYSAFKSMGFDYGASHQGLQEIYIGTRQVLAKLTLPPSVAETQGQFVLHPSLMDSALQASMALFFDKDKKRLMKLEQRHPFSLEELEITGQCTASMWAWLRASDGYEQEDKVQKFDIDLCDNEGQICASLKGLTFQSPDRRQKESSSDTGKHKLFIKEEWIPSPISDDLDWKEYFKHYEGKRIALIYSDEQAKDAFWSLLRQLEQASDVSRPLQIKPLNVRDITSDSFIKIPDVVFFLGPKRIENESIEPIETDLSHVFHVSQGLMKKGWGESVQIYYLFEGSPSTPCLDGEALSGFVRSAMMENNQHVWKLIGIYDPSLSTAPNQLLLREWLADSASLKDSRHDVEIRYENSQRFVRQLKETTLNQPLFSPFRHGGTYLITGGLGPVGELLCQELAKRYQATLIIISRSPLDNAKKLQRLKLEALGARVRYYSVDIADLTALREVYINIKRGVGVIQGVIHLARLVEDGPIISKTWESFQRVMKAKVKGTLNLDNLTSEEPLDFFMLFSSVAAFGIRGSSDYGYSTAFQNGFSRYRNLLKARGERSGLTIAQCWGPWTVDKYQPKNRDKNVKAAGFDLININAAIPMIEASCFYEKSVIGLMAVHDPALAISMMGIENHSSVSLNKISLNALEDQLELWEQKQKRGIKIVLSEINKVIQSKDIKGLSPTLLNRVHRLLFSENGSSSSEAVTIQPGDSKSTVKIVREHLSEVLGLNQVDDKQSFQNYGLDSISGMRLTVLLEEKLGRRIPPGWLIEFPTVQALSQHLLRTEKKEIPT